MENPQDEGDAVAQWCFNAQGDTLLQALAEEGERGQVLVAAAFLENLLTDCLLAKFKQISLTTRSLMPCLASAENGHQSVTLPQKSIFVGHLE